MSVPDSDESSAFLGLHGHQGERRIEMACAEPEYGPPDDPDRGATMLARVLVLAVVVTLAAVPLLIWWMR